MQIKLQREELFFKNCENCCIIIMNLQDSFLYCINLNQCAYKVQPCSMSKQQPNRCKQCWATTFCIYSVVFARRARYLSSVKICCTLFTSPPSNWSSIFVAYSRIRVTINFFHSTAMKLTAGVTRAYSLNLLFNRK